MSDNPRAGGVSKAADWGMLVRADRVLSWAETTFVGGALAFASLLLFVNVLLRYWFLAPIAWAEELSLYVMVWIVFVGSSVAIRTRGHIAIDLLPLVLSPVGRRRLAIFIALTVLAFLAVFFLLQPPAYFARARQRPGHARHAGADVACLSCHAGGQRADDAAQLPGAVAARRRTR